MTKTIVVVLAWNGERFLRPCLDALMRQDYEHDYEVIVVDNASEDRSGEIVRSYPSVALTESDHNRGFAGGNNLALRAIRDHHLPSPLGFQPDVVVLLNQDTEVAPDWLTEINRTWERHPQAGIVGCKAYAADHTTLQHAGGTLQGPAGTGTHLGAGEPDQGQYDQDASVEFVTGAALALRVELLDSVGVLDEGFAPAYYEDVDYCYRARAAGYDVIYTPAAQLIHYEGTSLVLRSPRHQQVYHRNRVRFLLKWRSLQQLEHEWAPEESADIVRWSTSDSLARKYAYVDALVSLPTIIRMRNDAANRADTYRRLTDIVRQLHHTVVQEESRQRTSTGYAFLAHRQEDQQP